MPMLVRLVVVLVDRFIIGNNASQTPNLSPMKKLFQLRTAMQTLQMHTCAFTHNFGNEGLTKTWYDMHFQIVKIEIDSETTKL